MNSNKAAIVFSGYGAFREADADADTVGEVIGEVNRVALARLKLRVPTVVTGDDLRRLRRWPVLVQLAVLGLSVAEYKCRRRTQARPAALVGHGLGELIALVCAEGFSVAEGAEIVCHRAAVLRKHCEGVGSMLALGVHASVAESLVKLVRPDRAGVAAENSHNETIVSGTHAALERIARLASGLNIQTKRLSALYPLHFGSIVEVAASELTDRLQGMTGRSLDVPVFSPMLGRHYCAIDHLGARVAEHLGKPIRFCAAIARLRSEGIDEFVQGGVLIGAHGWSKDVGTQPPTRNLSLTIDGSSSPFSELLEERSA